MTRRDEFNALTKVWASDTGNKLSKFMKTLREFGSANFLGNFSMIRLEVSTDQQQILEFLPSGIDLFYAGVRCAD